LHVFLSCPCMLHHFILLDLIILVIYSEAYRWQSFTLRSLLQPPAISSL
jgi:hypothetical protein